MAASTSSSATRAWPAGLTVILDGSATHAGQRGHWLPGWRERDRDEFRTILRVKLDAASWIVHGNYGSSGRDLVWARATTIVWLDLPLHQVMGQVTARTFRRWLHNERMWNGNRERLSAALFRPKDSILWWAWSTHRQRAKQYAKLLAQPRCQGVIRLQSRQEVDEWLDRLGA